MNITVDVLEQICPMDALDERIDINLEKDKLTYGQIILDTEKLIGDLKLTRGHIDIQIAIYEKLIARIKERALAGRPAFEKES